MKDTKIIEIDSENIDDILIEESAEILRKGGIVAFPTETVYGLGANGLNPKAIKKVFIAKGRPSDNPLIMHVSKIEDVLPLVEEIPEKAYAAMKKFWPGPLTIILKKSNIIPHEISGGLSTVAIRMPSHPIAIKLIEKTGLPIAAPSANISGKPSPTKAEHVIEDLMGKIDAIIVGGHCNIGVESTVLDMTVDLPTILRPGGVTLEMLEKVLGQVLMDSAIENPDELKENPKSPGMKYTHYSPNAELIVIQGDLNNTVAKIKELQLDYQKKGKKVGIISTDESRDTYKESGQTKTKEIIIKSLGSRKDPKVIAANLFKVLREFDKTNIDIILCESVDTTEIGQAIMNRLKKAAGYNIIKV